MKHRADFVKLGCTWMMILLRSLEAVHIPKKHAVTGSSCRPIELTAITKKGVEESLTAFENANGKNLGTWPPGFPKLQVHQNSPTHWAKVQCSLVFMDQGLEKLLEDQKNNLNPKDLSLHEKLRQTISRVNLLATCVKHIHREKCSSKDSPPTLPKSEFDKKKWGHTLLVTSREYLEWLEHQFGVQMTKVKGPNQIKRKANGVTFQKYLEGSGYFL